MLTANSQAQRQSQSKRAIVHSCSIMDSSRRSTGPCMPRASWCPVRSTDSGTKATLVTMRTVTTNLIRRQYDGILWCSHAPYVVNAKQSSKGTWHARLACCASHRARRAPELLHRAALDAHAVPALVQLMRWFERCNARADELLAPITCTRGASVCRARELA
jgi:hypothetical protein